MRLDYPTPLSVKTADLPGTAEALRFGSLDNQTAPFTPPNELLAAAGLLAFERLRGSTLGMAGPPATLPAELLAGLARTGTAFGYLVAWNGERLCVATGLREREGAERFARALGALVGGGASGALPTAAAALAPPLAGCLFGWPRLKVAPSHAPGPVDLLAAATPGERFFVLVYATPEPTSRTATTLRQLRSAAEELDRTQLMVGPQARVNRLARQVERQLERAQAKLERGLHHGLWRASVLVGADDASTLSQVGALLAGALGERSGVDGVPMRYWP